MDLKKNSTPYVLPPSVIDLCNTFSRITLPSQPLLDSMAVFNRSLQPVMESVAMMNRSLTPLGQVAAEMSRSVHKATFPATQALGAALRSSAFVGAVEAMRSPTMLQFGETIREMAAVGTAFNGVIDDSVGKEFLAVVETLRKVDWTAAIEESLEETEDHQDDELKNEAEAAGSFINTEFQSILDEVEQTPQGMIAALTVLRERVIESPLGKATKSIVLWMLSVILGNLFWAYICVPVGKNINQHFTHREALKATKQHILKEVGHHPQIRIVSVESRLNIRMKTNRKSHVVGKLYPYTVVTVIGHAGKWAKVGFANGQAESVEGWVFNKYLSRLK